MPVQLVQGGSPSGSNQIAAGRGSLPLMARILRAIREVTLTIIAIAGLACIAGLISGYFLGASLVVFKTGSMEPNYPVGAISLTVKIPADELRPGDVASVLREGSSVLITHRVVTVKKDPLTLRAGSAVLTLKGDANSSEDPVLYNVDSAQKVIFTVPGLGDWVMAMRGPWFLGAATLVVSFLVAWSFWPRKARKHRAEPGSTC